MKVTIDQIYWKVHKAKITIHDIFDATRENYNTVKCQINAPA